MADFPAIPLWTDAYLADTRHLSTLEHGAYLLLLMEAWRRPTRTLPDDDKLLARLAGLGPDEWAAIKDIVMAFWKRDGRSKTWSQKRLSLEAGYVRDRSQSQRGNAVKRWKGGKKEDAMALPKSSQKHAPTPTPIIEDDEARGRDREPPDPFGDIGSMTARFARAAGVAIMPNSVRFADQLDTVRGWIEQGLDPDTEIIPALEHDAVGRNRDRHSLKYYDPTMAGITARKEAQQNGQHTGRTRGASVDAASDFLEQRRKAREAAGDG